MRLLCSCGWLNCNFTEFIFHILLTITSLVIVLCIFRVFSFLWHKFKSSIAPLRSLNLPFYLLFASIPYLKIDGFSLLNSDVDNSFLNFFFRSGIRLSLFRQRTFLSLPLDLFFLVGFLFDLLSNLIFYLLGRKSFII